MRSSRDPGDAGQPPAETAGRASGPLRAERAPLRRPGVPLAHRRAAQSAARPSASCGRATVLDAGLGDARPRSWARWCCPTSRASQRPPTCVRASLGDAGPGPRSAADARCPSGRPATAPGGSVLRACARRSAASCLQTRDASAAPRKRVRWGWEGQSFRAVPSTGASSGCQAPDARRASASSRALHRSSRCRGSCAPVRVSRTIPRTPPPTALVPEVRMSSPLTISAPRVGQRLARDRPTRTSSSRMWAASRMPAQVSVRCRAAPTP